MDLICPKCRGTMRTYERNGVHVDQCSDCRGIFLDRGELERLVDAESAWHGRAAGGQTAAAHGGTTHGGPVSRTGGAAAGLGAGGLGAVVGEVLNQVQGKKHSSGSGSKRKQSFLGDLFG